jgi:hypothetical protein
MQGRILEKYSLYQTLAYIGIDGLTGLHHIIERVIALNDNEGAHFLLGHTVAGKNDRQKNLGRLLLTLAARKKL